MKSPYRLVSIHPVGSAEYKRDWDRLLPDGKTCGHCVLRNHCLTLFQDEKTECQFYPNRFEEGDALPIKIKKKRPHGKVKTIKNTGRKNP